MKIYLNSYWKCVVSCLVGGTGLAASLMFDAWFEHAIIGGISCLIVIAISALPEVDKDDLEEG